MSDAVRIAPLGGLGEVGMNCLTIEVAGRILVIDCGLTFPTYEPGVDVIHADFDWLHERRDDVEAIVLTHAHEDHVGAVPYLLDDVDAPIYGPAYAIELVKERLKEVEVEIEPRLNVIETGDRLKLGNFDIEPYHVCHSIPDAFGLIMRTPLGTLVHSGDFRFDEHPLDGRPLDVDALARARDEAGGIKLLMSDSTNSQVAGATGSETPVVEALEARIGAAHQRIVIGLFASNAHRVLGLLRAAKKHGRRVLALGRSLQTHLAIAARTGLPIDDLPPMVHPDTAQSIPRSELLVLVTGSQGEPLAALPRLARGEHHALKLEAGDEVILSSRIIPGREIPVHSMIDQLERRGVRVWDWHDDRGLHTSGHACRDEQQRLIELIRPHAFLPVHGNYAMLKRHAELAREVGVPHGIVAENGTVVELDDEGLHAVGTIRSGRVHRHMMVEVDDTALRERREMARRGLVMVGVTTSGGRVPRGQPVVRTRGLPVDDVLLKNARAEAARAMRTVERRGGSLPEVIARTLAGLFTRELGWRPVVEVLISEVDR